MSTATKEQIRDFVVESNHIEGIDRDPTPQEIEIHEWFLGREYLRVEDMQEFVAAVAEGAPIRAQQGMNVTVGGHMPPPGGPDIPGRLQNLLYMVNEMDEHPWVMHCRYETLHPFMDGNGRSGRAVWAWQMLNEDRPMGLKFKFLRAFYYQTLELTRP